MKTQTIKKIIYIMGVSGCGKSTVGRMLAEKLGLPFFDGDDFHPEANINKMKSGRPLDDTDRQGWLENLNRQAAQQLETGPGAVIACSALKQSYRDILQSGIESQTLFVYLAGSFEQIAERLSARSNHFMPPALLRSQFDALEEPGDAVRVSVESKPEEIVNEIYNQLFR